MYSRLLSYNIPISMPVHCSTAGSYWSLLHLVLILMQSVCLGHSLPRCHRLVYGHQIVGSPLCVRVKVRLLPHVVSWRDLCPSVVSLRPLFKSIATHEAMLSHRRDYAPTGMAGWSRKLHESRQRVLKAGTYRFLIGSEIMLLKIWWFS